MSLTGRLLVLVSFALVGLSAAMFAIHRSGQQSGATREKAAFAQAQSVTRALLGQRDALRSEVVQAIERGEPAPPALHAFVRTLLAPLMDAGAGLCLPDGTLVVQEVIGPPPRPGPGPPGPDDHFAPLGHRPPSAEPAPHGHGLLPIDRKAVVSACRERQGASPNHVRALAPSSVLFVTVAFDRAPLAAWVLLRVPRNDGGLFALGALPLLMVIAGSVVADGLRMMTAHLSYARERELALERRLSHERRLASLGRVAAGVAHEIRNPLAGMKLRLDAMARRKLDERSAHDVKRSLSEVARLDAVVSSLLSVSRKDPALLADVDLAALVDERLAALEPLASSRAVRVVRHGAAHAYVDAAGMARVIDNLVRNAIEASPEGAEVRVHLEVLDSRLSVRVTDVGPGVPPEREGELFEPFFTSKPDGTGLGLSLSRAVAEAHAGTLTYARTNGTTHFIVRLPLNEHSEAQP